MSMCDISKSAVKHRENVTCEGLLFTPHRRLQQIAISCKRSDYNIFFFKKKNLVKVSL